VDERVTRSGGVDQAARLGELLGMHHAFGSFMEYQGGRYGLAILSRCPITAAEPVRLADGNEPRVALVVTIALPDGAAIRVIDVHFDWVADDAFRFTQAGQVALLLDTLRAPYVLAGDFNDQPRSRTLQLFRERAVEAVKTDDDRLTFSAMEPRREIDFVFVGPERAWRNASARVITEPIASDHRPVVAEATLVEGSGSPAACGRGAGAGASVEGDNGEES
jgi:endonuclease/exonuclease/phosphatase family metal-dependent hydrolase